ncbi:MAG: hypothetical protein ACE5FS_14570 [Paracoccaceae bacterium]
MEQHISPEILEGLRRARRLAERKKPRLRVHAGDEVYPVLSVWEDGFAVEIDRHTHLRGLVDLYDGGRHLSQCLIIQSEPDGDVMRYEYKRRTDVTDHPAVDYVIPDDKPVALLR